MENIDLRNMVQKMDVEKLNKNFLNKFWIRKKYVSLQSEL